MWNKRIFLYLLKRLKYSRKKYLSAEKYGDVVLDGIDRALVFRFAYENWNIHSLILLVLRLKKIPEGLSGYNRIDFQHKQRSFIEKINSVSNECEKLNFIENFGGKETIKINYEGERFTKFFPFWNAVCKEYSPLILLVTGGAIGALASILSLIFNYLK